jgi:ORF6N domain-containing protein
MTSQGALVHKAIENRIYLLRGQKVLLDSDLATLYGVEFRALNQAVKRNRKRFPNDFVFRLTARERGGNLSSRPSPTHSATAPGSRRACSGATFQSCLDACAALR